MLPQSHFVPLVVNLQNKACIVIGGGKVAAKRVQVLVEAGAKVTIISPELCDELREQFSKSSFLWIQSYFHPDQIDGVFLVVAATNSSEINQRVVECAYLKGILVNSTSDGLSGDVIFPATVKQGDLMLSVTTLASSPGLTAKIAREMKSTYGSEYKDYVTLLGEMRQMIFERTDDHGLRVKATRELRQNPRILELLKSQELEEARKEALDCILSVLG